MGRGPLAILGCGAVGRALALGLAEAGEDLVLWSRDPRRALATLRSARRHARGTVERAPTARAAVARATRVLVCVAEPALEGVLRSLRPFPEGRLLFVASGTASLARMARALGAPVARFHPLCPVVVAAPVGLFRGMPFGIEGSERARRPARELCRALGGVPLQLRSGQAQAYHAGAALLGGGLVALFELADRALRGASASQRARREALRLFARRNLDHAAELGPVRALTGPVARGALANVRANLAALRRIPNAEESYRVLALTMLALARAKRPAAPRAALAALARACAARGGRRER